MRCGGTLDAMRGDLRTLWLAFTRRRLRMFLRLRVRHRLRWLLRPNGCLRTLRLRLRSRRGLLTLDLRLRTRLRLRLRMRHLRLRLDGLLRRLRL
ncbi:MAG: hypothetical protein BGP02_15395 [Pandoraea sp. 64-18]|nr:MAG: hypothetical protein BGP02_15395 [Pandoraea sp. 64-18]